MRLNLSKLRQEAKKFRKINEDLTLRLTALIELAHRETLHTHLKNVDYEIVAIRFEVSARTIYRWRKAYAVGGWRALKPQKAPGRRAEEITGWQAKRITEWRELCGWGAEVIQAHASRFLGVEMSQYRIHRFLKKKGLVGAKRRLKPASQHTSSVVVQLPGAHTQLDIKHQPQLLENGKKCYVYNFVDHASRWEFKRAYEGYGHWETERFMHELLMKIPFWILRLQTDNGVEFTNKYVSHLDNPTQHVLDEICAKYGISHKLIPPGEKELNGLVERSHRMDDQELYWRIKPRDIHEFNNYLDQYCEWKNSNRLRKALRWHSSNEYLAAHKECLKPGYKGNFLVADSVLNAIMKAG